MIHRARAAVDEVVAPPALSEKSRNCRAAVKVSRRDAKIRNAAVGSDETLKADSPAEACGLHAQDCPLQLPVGEVML